jgi:cytochrome c
MKIILPFLSFLFLIGCSESPSKTEETEPSTLKVEVNSTPSEENRTALTPSMEPTVTAVDDTTVDGGALYAQKCASCHGIKGEKAALGKSAVIADFSEQQTKDSLRGYQNGSYGKEMKGLMQGQVKGLNEAQIEALAGHISTL